VGTATRQPFHDAILEAARSQRGGQPWGAPVPEVVRAFSRAAGDYERAFRAAGFAALRLETVHTERIFASTNDAIAALHDSPLLTLPLDALDEPQRSAAWDDVAARYQRCERDGGCVFPMLVWLLAAQK
jgi:hypothetical protein